MVLNCRSIMAHVRSFFKPQGNNKNTKESYTVQGSKAKKYSNETKNKCLHGKPKKNSGRLNFYTSTEYDSYHKSNEKKNK